MSLNDKLKAAEKSEHNGGGSNWFKFHEGRNSIRVLTEPEPFFEDFKKGICYTDCGFTGSAKSMSWILDHADNKLKLMRIPYTITKMIGSWQEDEDWAFESFPMPYDINIDATGAGTKEVDYKVTPRPKREPVSSDVVDQVMKENTCAEVIKALKTKNIEKHKADGTWQKEQDRKANLKKELAEVRVDDDESVENQVDYPEYQGQPKFD